MNEIKEFDDICKDHKLELPLKLLKLVSTSCSFGYYFFDNLVWFAKMDFIANNDPLFHMKYKPLKNAFSLAKTVLELVISVYNIIRKEREEI